MADSTIFALTAVDALADGDVMFLVDVSDTTDSAQGSNKKVTAGAIKAFTLATGSVDNVILRADGTGGSTLQGSSITIGDYSATTQVNVSLSAIGAATDVALVLTPKGGGPVIFGPAPDGGATGGSARGVGSLCFVPVRNNANQVASGNYSVRLGGEYGYAQGADSVAIGGYTPKATAYGSVVIGGYTSTASGFFSVCLAGNEAQAQGDCSVAMGSKGVARRACELAQGGGRYDVQRTYDILRIRTTDDTPTVLKVGRGTDESHFTIPSGIAASGIIHVLGVAEGGTDYYRGAVMVSVINISGTLSVFTAPVVVGSEYKTDPATGCAVTVDASNQRIEVTVTGQAATQWTWAAYFDPIELPF